MSLDLQKFAGRSSLACSTTWRYDEDLSRPLWDGLFCSYYSTIPLACLRSVAMILLLQQQVAMRRKDGNGDLLLQELSHLVDMLVL